MRIEAAAIIAGLGGNPKTGMCRCPAHDDKNPSLSVKQSGDTVLFHCFTGCSQDAVIDALKARGLWGERRAGPYRPSRPTAPDAFDEIKKFSNVISILRGSARGGRPTAYLNSRGLDTVPPCARVLAASDSARLLGKRYPAMVCPIIAEDDDDKAIKITGAHITFLNAAGDGKLATADNNARRMYGTAKGGYVALAQADPSKPLIIGEGIESVLAAMEISGLPGVAALSVSGLQSIRPPVCNEVIVAADHDEPGRKAAAQLAKRLAYEGREVRVALPPVEGADWNDRLLDAVNVETEWEAALAAGDPELSDTPNALEESAFMGLAFPKRELLLSPWLPQAGLVMIHAPRGEGKTYFALSVGKALAGCHDLLGWTCSNYGRVLFVDGELPGAALQQRLGRFQRSPPGAFHILGRDAFLLRKKMIPDLGAPEGRQELDRIIEKCKPDLVILDSLSTLVRSGIENDAESWSEVQQWLLKHRWAGRTMLLVHHEGKSSGRQRGTSKREDVLDTVISLRKNAEESTTTESVFDLTFTKARDFYGEAADPMRLRLAVEEGQLIWRHEKIRDVQRERVREMMDAGMKGKDIAKELDLTPGRVSQIVKEIKLEGNVVAFPGRKDEQTLVPEKV